MSTEYATLKKILACDLFDGRLGRFNVFEHLNDEANETKRCLSDSRNYVWVHIDANGFVACITRYGRNAPRKILDAISDAFDTDIVSEYEPEYWGFDTQEEWDAAMDKLAAESKDRFYIQILKYLRGEANDLIPGTIGMIEAQIAERLVAQEPELMLVQNKNKLLSAIDEVYQREHVVQYTLSAADVAFARMIVTHEDDLPQG